MSLKPFTYPGPENLVSDSRADTFNMPGFYQQCLKDLCRQRRWQDPSYECHRDQAGYKCMVLVDGGEYQTDFAFLTEHLARESAARRAYVSRRFSSSGGMLTHNTHDSLFHNTHDSLFHNTHDSLHNTHDSLFHNTHDSLFHNTHDSLFHNTHDSLFHNTHDSLFHNTHDSLFQGLPSSDADRRKKSRYGLVSHTGYSYRSRYSDDHLTPPFGRHNIDIVPGAEPSIFASSLPGKRSIFGSLLPGVRSIFGSLLPGTRSIFGSLLLGTRSIFDFSVLGERFMSPPGLKVLSSTPALPKDAANDCLAHILSGGSISDVAIGEYEWLAELQSLGYSAREIADILLEKSRDGPCMFTKLEIPDVPKFVDGFHQKECVHSGLCNVEVESRTRTLKEAGPRNKGSEDGIVSINGHGNNALLSPLENIEYFCGVGGVKPTYTGHAEMLYGTLDFEDDNSIAISALHEDSVIGDVLISLEQAAGTLQQLQGCCDSFSFLWLHASYAELVRMDLGVVRQFGDIPLYRLVPQLSDKPQLSLTLMAQFLSLAFLSYSQAHCGDIRPFFLDTPLSRVILIGNQKWTAEFKGPCIVGSLVGLSCFGDMLQQSVFAFQYLDQYDREAVLERRSDVDLLASPEDILDTWGPGGFMAPEDDKENLYAISIGGGLITPISMSPVTLHWSLTTILGPQPSMTFRRTEKVRIGAKVSSNDNCQAKPQEQLQLAFSLLEELGTSPSYWEVSERQLGLGLQAGQGAIALLQFNQTWVKRRGLTKKSKLLAQRAVYLADLEGYFGIQVSVCTGIARRVRLRDLLSEVLPAYVGALVAKPPGWKSLLEDFKILQALKEGDLGMWLGSMNYNLQKTFESLVVAILFLLQDTGVDRKGENFIIGCIQPDIPFQCFNIPCRRENYWARMVADSEDIATFVYATTQCLEIDTVKCPGSNAHWANSTALLWTAVSCCEEERLLRTANALPSSTSWRLKHSEAYLIGKPEAPLLVQVDRLDDHEEPRLLVSVSLIRPDILRRLYRKASSSKLRRLRERGAFSQKAENVMVLTGTGGRLGS